MHRLNHLWLSLAWLRCQQRFYQHKIKHSPNGDVLKTCWDKSLKPIKDKSRIAKGHIEFLVADLEMSSLDKNEGEIISIGWVVIKRGKIQLASAEHHLLKAEKTVGQSATIHNLRDCELQQGKNIEDVMQRFLQIAAGKILVFHHAPLDIAYLNKASIELYSSPLLLPIIDTLAIEKQKLMHQQEHIKTGELRLAECRSRYNLPAYPAHNALMDALSAAELLIAQLKL